MLFRSQADIKNLVAIEIHHRGGVALLAGKEVLIDPQHLRAGSVRHLGDSRQAVALIPPFGRGDRKSVV